MDDRLTSEERIRLECLKLATNVRTGYQGHQQVALAKEYARYVKEGDCCARSEEVQA